MSQNIFVFFQTLIIDFLQLIVIWVRNIKKIHIYTMKFKVHGHSYQKMLFIFLPHFFNFYQNHNKECPPKIFEQVCKCSFGEICSKHSLLIL